MYRNANLEFDVTSTPPARNDIARHHAAFPPSHSTHPAPSSPKHVGHSPLPSSSQHRPARKAPRTIHIPPTIHRRARIRAQQPLPQDPLTHGIVPKLGRDNRRGRDPVLDPGHEREQGVVARVLEARHAVHTRRLQRSGLPAAGEVPRRVVDAARAVLHPRHEEEAVPVSQGDAAREQGA